MGEAPLIRSFVFLCRGLGVGHEPAGGSPDLLEKPAGDEQFIVPSFELGLAVGAACVREV
jgi:hypothetical protein